MENKCISVQEEKKLKSKFNVRENEIKIPRTTLQVDIIFIRDSGGGKEEEED